MGKKRTQEEYVELLNEMGKGEYELIPGEVYQNNKFNLETLHKKCGRITAISPRNFMNGQRCSSCTKEDRITKQREEKHIEFVKHVAEISDGDYELIEGEKFISNDTPIQLLHKICGNIYNVRPYEFKKGCRCPKCRSYKRKSHEDFLEDFLIEAKDEYEMVVGEKYVNSATPIRIRHVLCNQEYHATPKNFLRGQARCSKCKEKLKSTQKNNPEKIAEFVRKVKELTGDEYIALDTSNLLNSKSRVQMKHTTCGYEYDVVTNQFIQGSRCPACAVAARKNRNYKKKTHSEFLKEVHEQGDTDYELVEGSIYVNNLTHVQMRHKVCGNEYPVSPANFLSGRRCPECSERSRGIHKRKGHNEFVEEVYGLVKDEYAVLGTYYNSGKKVAMRHNLCGYEWNIIPASFLRGTRCPSCKLEEVREKHRKTLEDFRAEVFELEQGNYIIKDGEIYVNNQTLIKMIHTECGHEYEVRPANFLNKRRCPACNDKVRGEKTRKPLEQLRMEIELQGKGEYELTENAVYVNTDTPIEMTHKSCGHTWNIVPSSFLRGNGCPACNGGVKRTHEQFVDEVKAKGNNEYTVSQGETYKNNHTHIKLIHNECGTEFSTTPGNFFNGNMCPKCSALNNSKGEKEIADILELNHIEFIPQHTFENCRYKRLLRFDFAVLYKGELKCLIEFNGQQHYYAIDYFGGEEALKETQKRDDIKRRYAKKHNIPLIEIRFDEGILPKLTKEFQKLNIHMSNKEYIAA